MEVETAPIVSGSVRSASIHLRCNTFCHEQRAGAFPSTPIERCKATPSALCGDLRKAPSARYAQRTSMGQPPPVHSLWACKLPSPSTFKASSRVLQEPISRASFRHYVQFLVQSARIFSTCSRQKHSISFFSYTEGPAHLSHERPPVFDTRSVAHACRSNLAFVLTISGHWCEPLTCTHLLNHRHVHTDPVYTC